MKRENTRSRREARRHRSPPRREWDRRGMGGFYEAIMAMMIVTAGIVLLTCSFAFLSVGEENDDDLQEVCRDISSSVLADRKLCPSERMVDQRELDRMDWTALKGNWTGGVAIFLTLPDGSSRTLYRDEGSSNGERCAISEPVNIIEHGGIVSAGLLTVWVWP